MTHRRVLLGFAAIGVVTLAGCAPQGPVLATDGGDVYAVIAAPSDVAMDALASGHLVLDDNGCFAIEVGSEPSNVLWAHGSSLDGNRLKIAGIDHSLGEGTLISMGGGEVTADSDQPPCWNEGDTIWVMAPDSGAEGTR